jgi:hypothetical protein
MHPSVALMLRNPRTRFAIERALAGRGQRGDTMLAHINPAEAATLRAMGGAGTRNPRTGLPQFYLGTGGDTRADPGAPGGGSSNPNAGGGGFAGGRGVGGSGRGGQGNYRQDVASGVTPPPAAAPSAVPPSVPNGGNNMPPAAQPVTTAPMMSDLATIDLTGARYGALPSWATRQYQIGAAPTSYPTPGVNTGIGWTGGSSGASSGGGPGGLGGTGGLPGGGVPAGGGTPGLPSNNGPGTGNINPDLYANTPLAAMLAKVGLTPADLQYLNGLNSQQRASALPVLQGQNQGAQAPTQMPAAANTQAQGQPPSPARLAATTGGNPYTPGTAAWQQWQLQRGLPTGTAQRAPTISAGGLAGLGGARLGTGAPRNA